jgi:hypothetical protein
MSLNSIRIDTQLAKARNEITALSGRFQAIKKDAALAISDLSQFETNYSGTIAAVTALAGSSSPADQLKVAQLAEIVSAVTELSTDLAAAKAAIDMLEL